MEQSAKGISLNQAELDELAVRCLVLALHEMSLLLPNTMVAEVIDYKPAEATGHMPAWMIGMLSWRGRNVPVISFERLLGRDIARHNRERRYVVCNTLSGNPRVPFVALEVQGIPHLTMVRNDMLVQEPIVRH